MRFVKRLTTLAAVLLLLGAILLGVTACTGAGGDGSRAENYEKKSYEITDEIHDITISDITADVSVLPYDGDVVRIETYGHKKMIRAIDASDGNLSISVKDERDWWDFISLGQLSYVKVYLPDRVYGSLDISITTGDVNIGEFKLDSITVEATTGDVTNRADSLSDITLTTTTGDVQNYGSAAGALRITATTGDVKVDNASVGSTTVDSGSGGVLISSLASSGDLGISVTTGDIYLSAVSCGGLGVDGGTGFIQLSKVVAFGDISVDNTTGDVRLDLCDGKNIYIDVTTGDVTGRILTEKVFSADSATGDVKVPDYGSGGTCRINATTGDIRIELAS